MKRYAIVRVDGSCPMNIEKHLDELERDDMFCRCNDLEMNCKDCLYGDTKEQLIRKVAQALLIDEIERYRKAPNCDVNQTIIEHVSRICLEKARKIVEFLGVEE